MNRALTPLANLYGAGTHLRLRAYQQGWLKSRRLPHPVISVGNLTVGGSGKTPIVAQIAGILLQYGHKPGILTRGYGRENGPDLIVLEPQRTRSPDSRATGDEPALLARMLPEVPILICTNRHQAGQLAEERFGVDVHILDDGFQHFALERDIDLVAVDVTQELFGGALLPVGRLREPASALARADMIVLTRTEIGDTGSMEEQVNRINPAVPIFLCTSRFRGLIDLGSQRIIDSEEYCGKPICAFCGVGNASAFWSDLRKWGFNPTSEIAFRDHHVYRSADVGRLNRIAREKGAVAFLTTEKDVMNLPPQPGFGLPVLACAIRAEISDAERFGHVILARLASKRVPSGVGIAK